MDWIKTPNITQRKTYEVPDSKSESTLDKIYIDRYSNPLPEIDDLKIQRYADEIFNGLRKGSSLLIIGSGHPDLAKMIREKCKNLGRIGCVDRIEEASIGLKDYDIDFYKLDILVNSLPREYEYVFSSHMLEHFTREELLGKVIPRMKDAAFKSIYAVVPYEEAWSGEPTHRCRFYVGDELFCASKRYKLIHNNNELVLNI